MSLILSGTNGLSDVDGSAATPAIRGTDANTGIFFPAADTIAFSEGGVEAMRIDSSGNVGIGTSSPATRLHVAQTLKPQLTLTDATLGQAYGGAIQGYGVGGEGGYLDLGTWDNSVFVRGLRFTDNCRTIQFSTGASSTERMRIDSSGNLLVGTTTFASGQNGVLMRGTSGGATDEVLQVRTSGTGSKFNTGFYNDNGRVGSIQTNGSSTSFVTSSDYRLKEDIAPMMGALAKVALLKPVTYKWKVDGSDGQGFIAHELNEVVPDCVSGGKDAVDADGNPVYQGIDTSFLVATLTAAIQELKALVDTQASTITTLTDRITALEAKP
jgi:hypothetical protein